MSVISLLTYKKSLLVGPVEEAWFVLALAMF